MHVSARASILIKPGQIRVRSGSDPDYYPGQWVIRVSDVDPVSTLMVTAYRPDIVIYNSNTSAVALLELTCSLDSEHHLEAARSRKQGIRKLEYQQLLAELHRLDFSNYYQTLEVSVLGHYQKSSVKNVLNVLHFIHSDLSPAKAGVRQMLDTAAMKCISASQRIFMSRKCSEWFPPDLN